MEHFRSHGLGVSISFLISCALKWYNYVESSKEIYVDSLFNDRTLNKHEISVRRWNQTTLMQYTNDTIRRYFY